ncbi:methyltransferase [Barrientosiimonas endolithica]|uniref:Methyltransferase small domain-containing protein n=1 Tax=Barrientosiimonas endolithica TaxID=1535208 RepID=A0ABM8HC41_9MICO|nr:methyltransferase [Barrientosiimonas endolithica]BDZ58526.1 hypothetical protein GCM10025872_21830 [Barrientosiimonas endolithica]
MSDREVDAAAGASVTAFGGLRIVADDRLLQPREWTVAQAEWAAELAADAPDGALLELCCGAGQIGLLAARLTGRPLLAVDQDPIAVRQTEANARAAGLDGQVQTRRGRIDEVLDPDDRFAIVLADPPWVPHAQITRFPQDPPVAIDGERRAWTSPAPACAPWPTTCSPAGTGCSSSGRATRSTSSRPLRC